MAALQLIPVVLSLLVLAAHFLRAGNLPVIGGLVLLLGLLGVQRWWSARILQLVLLLGTIEWVRTLVRIATIRSEAGEPALRMAIILGAVAVLSLLAACMFQTVTLRRRYRLTR